MKDDNDNDTTKVPTQIRTPELMQEGQHNERANRVMEQSQLGQTIGYYIVELAQ